MLFGLSASQTNQNKTLPLISTLPQQRTNTVLNVTSHYGNQESQGGIAHTC